MRRNSSAVMPPLASGVELVSLSCWAQHTIAARATEHGLSATSTQNSRRAENLHVFSQFHFEWLRLQLLDDRPLAGPLGPSGESAAVRALGIPHPHRVVPGGAVQPPAVGAEGH